VATLSEVGAIWVIVPFATTVNVSEAVDAAQYGAESDEDTNSETLN